MKYRFLVLISLCYCISLTACVTPKELILPTRDQRIEMTDAYRVCVTRATNTRYDSYRTPEEIVRQAIDACKTTRFNMVKDYPKDWRDNYARTIDEELYQQEITWVIETRKKEIR